MRRARKRERDIAIARIACAKLQTAHDRPRVEQRVCGDHAQCERHADFLQCGTNREDNQCYHTSLQNLFRVAGVIEGMSVEQGAVVKILFAPHFGPCRINAEGNNRQQEIDNPDGEIFGTFAAEMKAIFARLAIVGQRQIDTRDVIKLNSCFAGI